MTTIIALLRGINVGGKNLVPMAGLRAAALEVGLDDPATLLQSGNLVARAASARPAEIEASLEAIVAERIGPRIDVMVRTAKEWATVIAKNPFDDLAASDPSHLVAMILKEAPKPAAVESLRAAIVGNETIEAVGRTLYVAYPDGIGTSKLTNAIIERKLATSGTARNWNTVLKIRDLAASMA